MEINDELIACFVDGTATEAECRAVRQYLAEHPAEREAVLHLMDMNASEHLDWDVEDEPTAHSTSRWSIGSMVADMAMPAAGFVNMGSFSAASMLRRAITPKKGYSWGGRLDSANLDDRWDELCGECFGD